MGRVRASAEAWMREVFLPVALGRCEDPNGEGGKFIDRLWSANESLAVAHTDLHTTTGIARALESLTDSVLNLTPDTGKNALHEALSGLEKALRS